MKGSGVTAAAPAGTSYDSTTVLLHWVTVFLVLSIWGAAQLIDVFPRGAARYPMRSTHMLLGLLLGVVLACRIRWRASGGRRLTPLGTPLARALSRGVHLLLYALLVGEVLLGMSNAWLRGDHVFQLFQIPALAGGNPLLKAAVGSLHDWGANLILALAGLHAAAALYHHFVLRDGLLHRMGRQTEIKP
jgi:cytochrome b561